MEFVRTPTTTERPQPLTHGVAPFLKWAGGKRWLARHILPHLPPGNNLTYFEPFLGGGAVFLAVAYKSAVLSDINPELIAAYREVQKDPERLVARLLALPIDAETYYSIRSAKPQDRLGRAVRFLYLNRTAWNGLYRVNQRGEFNVPFGCKPGTKTCEPEALRAASRLLQCAELRCGDFGTVVKRARPGDVVYFDPPYTVKHDNNGFRRYNEAIFSWRDQERLAKTADSLRRQGVFVAVSNAHHESILQLYGTFRVIELHRTSCLSADPSMRGTVREYLFLSE